MHPALIIATITAVTAGLYIHDCWEHARYIKRINAPVTVSFI